MNAQKATLKLDNFEIGLIVEAMRFKRDFIKAGLLTYFPDVESLDELKEFETNLTQMINRLDKLNDETWK